LVKIIEDPDYDNSHPWHAAFTDLTGDLIETDFTEYVLCPCCRKGLKLAIDGADVRKCRKSLGVSLRQAAKEMKISAMYLSDIERGNRYPPVDSFLSQWKKFLEAHK